jgi:dGTPase
LAGLICDHLKRQSSLLSETFYIDPDLVEAVCLAHDLGHPPFGHANERLLNHLMRHYGGFEANAQTLRIITEIFYSNKEERSGMAPTRALVDGIMKYKTLHSQLKPAISQFIYDEQQKYLDFVFDNRPIPGNITPGEKLNSFRSIECQIMDWADDIAFSLNDFADCIRAGLIAIDNVKKWVKENSVTSSLNPVIYKSVAAMEKGDIPDPIGQGIETYRQCAEQLAGLLRTILEKLAKRLVRE